MKVATYKEFLMTEKILDFRVNYNGLKIFDEFNTKDFKFPIVLSSPHAGNLFPKEFLENSVQKIHSMFWNGILHKNKEYKNEAKIKN